MLTLEEHTTTWSKAINLKSIVSELNRDLKNCWRGAADLDKLFRSII